MAWPSASIPIGPFFALKVSISQAVLPFTFNPTLLPMQAIGISVGRLDHGELAFDAAQVALPVFDDYHQLALG